jgi:HD-like signal output (HDOD) protein
MRKWIAHWFGRGDVNARAAGAAGNGAPTRAPAPHVAAPAATEPEPDTSAHGAEIDTVFYRWLSGAGELDARPSTEKLILDELARLALSPAAGAELVPRVPAVIPQLLRSLRDDSVSGADLSRQLAQDVVLVGEVIREANSPFYRPATPVRTIEGAVMLLGQNGMRMLLARVAFRPIISMQAGRFARQVAPHVWSQSERCASAANVLAPGLGANPFDAYLAGLMQNVGLIVAFRLIDQIDLDDVLPQSDQFCKALLALARTISSGIAALWGFPEVVATAIAEAGSEQPSALARTLALSDRLSKLRLLVDAGQFAPDDPFVLQGLTPAALACFKKLDSEAH